MTCNHDHETLAIGVEPPQWYCIDCLTWFEGHGPAPRPKGYATDIPLICDEPPRRLTILTVPGRLTIDQVERIKAQWAETVRTGVVVLSEGISIRQIDVGLSGGWPDWEHCAA